MKRYNAKEIESKWQKIWDEQETYKVNLDSDKTKYIAYGMFNYPSGAGIHIGHSMNFTISDVLARFKRQQGYESYNPVGWDSFGLPAENYAIKSGVSPQASMAKIIPNYHKQYKAMGWSNDWSKEIATHTPEYYKWTQWIFAEMFRAGLAYQDARMQWWCTKCQTVLANEQVIDGKCWRHDGPDDPIVEKKEVKQWFFKITDYAEELLEAIDDLDWTESVKLAQKNWIGKSEGANVRFKIKGLEAKDEEVEVFTTAHDTIFGATFLVLAPEHPIVTHYGQYAANAQDIADYVAGVTHKTELERMADKQKHGIAIEGLTAVNPANGQEIPVWTADYVLMGYGTGAVMAVPGQDERDYEFAQKHGLPIIYTTDKNEFVSYSDEIKPNRKQFTIANSGEFDGMDFEKGRQAILEKLVSDGTAEAVTQYKMRDWSVSRQRYWGAPIPIINCEKCGPQLVSDDKLPVTLPELDDFKPSGDGRSALARATDWLTVDCPKCGGKAERETDTLDTYICSSWYMFRYLDPHNTEEAFSTTRANKWMPVDFYNGADHATAHMLYARFVTRFFHKKGLVDSPEPFKKFLFNGKVTAADGQMFSKSKGNGVDPLEIIESGYGADALRTYLMFAAPLEFWAKWDPQGVPGAHRFLSRLWTLTQEFMDSDETALSPETVEKLRQASNKMVYKVTNDIEENRYNTAIAALMACVNDLYKIKTEQLAKSKVWRETLESVIMCVAPFAPFIAEELWHQLGNDDSVHRDHWPKWDAKYLTSENVVIVVQVNGKVRARIEAPADSDEATVTKLAKQDVKATEYLTGKIQKTIFVPNKIINFVVKN